MSRIWDSLTTVERQASELSRRSVNSVADRRCGPRVWAYAPLLVYGHTANNEPFHEPTEALRVNASGGLFTLTTAVRPGDLLLLINKLNHKEQKCHVGGHRVSYLNRSAVSFEFSESIPDFWDVKQQPGYHFPCASENGGIPRRLVQLR
jgi:hypothetical protein